MKDSTSVSNHTTGFPSGNIFPDILWIFFWLLLLYVSRDFIKTTLTTLLNRLKHGAGIKIGSFELKEIKVTPGNDVQNPAFQIKKDKTGDKEKERASIYKIQRGVMMVHKIFKSQEKGQLYDILIYLIPHKGSNLIQVISVDYFFGRMWNDNIFSSSQRSNGFAIATCAYGPFLCSAQIHFNDGSLQTIYRYIDFEMGDVAIMANNTEQEGKKA